MVKFHKVLVTGGAGFIGSHLVDSLLADEIEVAVLDQHIQQHKGSERYRFFQADIRDRDRVFDIFAEWKPEIVVHLAAKAGVRLSLHHPADYVEVNVKGTSNILEAAATYHAQKVIFGSSSSVYGLNQQVPFSEESSTLLPASPYAATKIAGEALCHSFSHCFTLPVIALRFFTVYGPRQRVDLAIRKFATKIMQGEPISVYGDGSSSRDYTYISDIVSGIRKAIAYETTGYEVFNLGSDDPVKLIDLVSSIEKVIGKQANIEWLPDQTGDVPITWADLTKSKSLLGYQPTTELGTGLELFYKWLQSHAE